MTTRQASKIIKDELDRLKLSYTKISARTVDFQDLARRSRIFVTVDGWEPNPIANNVSALALQHGFYVAFTTTQGVTG